MTKIQEWSSWAQCRTKPEISHIQSVLLNYLHYTSYLGQNLPDYQFTLSGCGQAFSVHACGVSAPGIERECYILFLSYLAKAVNKVKGHC